MVSDLTFLKEDIIYVFLILLAAGLSFVYLLNYRKTRKKMELFYRAVENSSESVCITDADANIEYVNPAFCETTGFDRKEVLGKNPRIMKSGHHEAAFYKDMWKTLTEKGEWKGEVWDRRKNGEIYPKRLSITAIKDNNGNTIKYLGIFSDITAIKKTEDYLEHLAFYDELTGLPNRILLRERLRQAMLLANRNKHYVAVLALDIDQFEKINNALGYPAGDDLLKEMAQRLLKSMDEKNTIARMGTDEFTIVLTEPNSRQEVLLAAQKIKDEVSRRYVLKGSYDVFVSVSIGITIYPSDADRIDNLLRNADMAVSSAKEQGGNRFQFYSYEMDGRYFEYLSIESNLRHALENGEFVLYYQPIADLHTGRTIGMEALIRRREKEWLAPPSSFIKVAEETGLILAIVEWTLRNACKQTVIWQREGLPPLRLSVNLTAAQFYHQRLIETIRDVLYETDLAPDSLDLELTEGIIIHDTAASIKMMHELKELGIRLSIDDFGTGYSSLSYLKKFPVDKVKIDKSFVKDIPNDPESTSIAKAIIAMAHALNLRVNAEGVESEGQLVFLKEQGCDEIQGYYFSVPLPAESFRRLILEDRRINI